jgi:hypothetical protein
MLWFGGRSKLRKAIEALPDGPSSGKQAYEGGSWRVIARVDARSYIRDNAAAIAQYVERSVSEDQTLAHFNHNELLSGLFPADELGDQDRVVSVEIRAANRLHTLVVVRRPVRFHRGSEIFEPTVVEGRVQRGILRRLSWLSVAPYEYDAGSWRARVSEALSILFPIPVIGRLGGTVCSYVLEITPAGADCHFAKDL